MINKRGMELLVGFLMLIGMLALLILALKVSGLSNYIDNDGYVVSAEFDHIGDLKLRSPVTLAGVRIGKVTGIRLDDETFRAKVTMKIDKTADKIPADSSLQILTQGLLGSNYISVTPGFSDDVLKANGVFEETHPAIILENLVSQFLFNIKSDDKEKSSGGKK